MNTTDKKVTGTVVEVSELSLTVDANHPLASQDLTYEVHIVEIV